MDDDEVEERVVVAEADSTANDRKLKKQKEKKNGKDEKRGGKSSRSTASGKQQHLFLVEFLVDTVTIDTSSVDEEVLEGQTCISLSFLNFPPMEICEKDFDPNKEQGLDKVRFNCGKSLMFAFNEHQCEHPPALSVEITVFKKIGDEEKPCKVEIGTIKICVSELFRQIVETAKFKPEKLPTSKSIKDCFMLIGPGKRTMGEVSVYIRFSCLGQNVVTEFQCGPDLKTSPVLFKSREGKKAYEFKGNDVESGGEAPAGPLITMPDACRGGQGDAGRSSLSVDGADDKGNKAVSETTDKSSRQGNRQKGPNKSGDYRVKQGKAKNASRAKDGVTVSQTASDPDHNCFVLRVGDKGQVADRGKMILEFRTPKQKMLPKVLPPYHEEVGVQTETGKKGKGKPKKKK